MATKTESQAWIPEQPGDKLTGTIVEVIRAWSDARTNGGKDMERGWYPLIRLKTDNGNIRDWHAFGAVAENRVLDKQPLPGETITVTYLGISDKTPPKGMNAPKLFQLDIAGRDPRAEAADVYAQLGARERKTQQAPPDDDIPWTDADLGS